MNRRERIFEAIIDRFEKAGPCPDCWAESCYLDWESGMSIEDCGTCIVRVCEAWDELEELGEEEFVAKYHAGYMQRNFAPPVKFEALPIGPRVEVIVRSEPVYPGPMPFRLRLYAMFFPERWTREVCRVTMQKVLERAKQSDANRAEARKRGAQ